MMLGQPFLSSQSDYFFQVGMAASDCPPNCLYIGSIKPIQFPSLPQLMGDVNHSAMLTSGHSVRNQGEPGFPDFLDIDTIDWSIAIEDTPGGSPGEAQFVWPPIPPVGCTFVEPPGPVEGYIPNATNTGQRDTIPASFDWQNRGDAAGPPNNLGAFSRMALQSGANATKWFIGLNAFANNLPAGATISGCRLTVDWRQRRSASAGAANEMTMQAMRLNRNGSPVAGSERAEPVSLFPSGVFPSEPNAPWTTTVFGGPGDLWGMPQSFWDEAATVNAINGDLFGFEFWFIGSGTTGTPGIEYLCELDAAFMEILYELPFGASGSIIAPAGCVGCGDGPGLASL